MATDRDETGGAADDTDEPEMSEAVTVRSWTEQEFLDSRAAWSELLNASDADPLFMSWEWLRGWWSCFARLREPELRIIVAIDTDGVLQGIAPMMVTRARIRGVIPVRRLEMIGNYWRGPGTIPTEYGGFLIRRGASRRVIEGLIRYLEGEAWDEMALSWIPRDAVTRSALERTSQTHGYLFRDAELRESYIVDTRGSFQAYLAGLSRNARPKLYNRRKNLEKHGTVRLTTAGAGEVDAYFSLLNQLHECRWGRPAFAGDRLAFHRALAQGLGGEGRLHFSALWVGERPLSVLYNYRVAGREYYLQGGFDEAFDSRLSPGLLHLGYVLEQAFADPDVGELDLLAGEGKRTQYKAGLASKRRELMDFQVVRSPVLRAAYRIHGWLRNAGFGGVAS